VLGLTRRKAVGWHDGRPTATVTRLGLGEDHWPGGLSGPNWACNTRPKGWVGSCERGEVVVDSREYAFTNKKSKI
jgi:hypothetical protein